MSSSPSGNESGTTGIRTVSGAAVAVGTGVLNEETASDNHPIEGSDMSDDNDDDADDSENGRNEENEESNPSEDELADEFHDAQEYSPVAVASSAVLMGAVTGTSSSGTSTPTHTHSLHPHSHVHSLSNVLPLSYSPSAATSATDAGANSITASNPSARPPVLKVPLPTTYGVSITYPPSLPSSPLTSSMGSATTAASATPHISPATHPVHPSISSSAMSSDASQTPSQASTPSTSNSSSPHTSPLSTPHGLLPFKAVPLMNPTNPNQVHPTPAPAPQEKSSISPVATTPQLSQPFSSRGPRPSPLPPNASTPANSPLSIAHIEAEEASRSNASSPTTGNGTPTETSEMNPSDSSATDKQKKKTLGYLFSHLTSMFTSSSTSSTPMNSNKAKEKPLVKVTKHNKSGSVNQLLNPPLSPLIHSQTIDCSTSESTHSGPIWVVSISNDGQYLATGGEDSVVRVWAVNGSAGAKAKEKEEKEKEEKEKKDKEKEKEKDKHEEREISKANGNGATANSAVTESASTSPYGHHLDPPPIKGHSRTPSHGPPSLLPSTPSSSTSSSSSSSAESDFSSSSSSSSSSTSSGPLYPSPYRVYSGHKSHVIDLAWSKANFLLSASIDKTVRLWHISRTKCLTLFHHPDFVTAVSFHPAEDRFFLSASFDKKLRIWDIPTHRVIEWCQTSNIITSAAYHPSGTLVVAGLIHGTCVFFTSPNLRYHTQVECKNKRGKNRKGKKVTGISFTNNGDYMLVTTNDSRVRLYELETFSLLAKFKGILNEELQIKSQMHENGMKIICGSEGGEAVVWDIPPVIEERRRKERSASGQLVLTNIREGEGGSTNQSNADHTHQTLKVYAYESFKAMATIATSTLFLPSQTLKCLYGDEYVSRLEREGKVHYLIVVAGYEGELKLFETKIL